MLQGSSISHLVLKIDNVNSWGLIGCLGFELIGSGISRNEIDDVWPVLSEKRTHGSIAAWG